MSEQVLNVSDKRNTVSAKTVLGYVAVYLFLQRCVSLVFSRFFGWFYPL